MKGLEKWFIKFTALASKDSNLALSTYIVQLTTVCNSISRGFNAIFLLLWVLHSFVTTFS